MKVLHVTPSVAPRYGGPTTALFDECRVLAGAGVGTNLITTDADGPDRLPVAYGDWCEFHGIRTMFFGRYGGEAFKWAPGLSRWLRRHVAEFDVVHIRAVLSHASLAAAAACRAHGVPYVLEPLGTLDRWSLEQKSLRKTVLLSLLGRRAIAGAAALRCTSAREAADVAGRFPGTRTATVPLGITPTADAPPPAAAREPYVLSLCRLHPVKRIDTLIDAFERATARAPYDGWRLVVAGDGDADYVAALKARAAASAAAPRIEFTGWVDGAARDRLLRCAAVFALISHHENFGMALAEALAAGTPALLSKGVHLSEEVAQAHAGWVAGTGSGEVAATLATAMGSPRDRESRAARELSHRFEWPAIADRLQRLYRDLASRGAARAVTASPALDTHPS